MNSDKNIFSEEQKDILQEIMNIAFGNATADLSDVIDVYVELSVPDIELLVAGELATYIVKNVQTHSRAIVINQRFLGEFKGSGFFVFPNGAGHDLADMLEESDTKCCEAISSASLEKEIIMEIGNILIGACVGKISEMLNTSVIYSPPQAIYEKSDEFNRFLKSFDPTHTAIAMKTVFRFQQKDIKGFILVIADHESIEWLKDALDNFMESYQ